MSSFFSLVRASIPAGTSAKFWFFYLSSTVAAAIFVYFTMRRVTTQRIPHETYSARSQLSVWNLTTVAAITSTTAFLTCYIIIILYAENFLNYDNSHYTINTLRGIDISPSIWPSAGRFFPLADQEFNVVRHFTNTILGYFIIPVGQLIIFTFNLLVIDSEINILPRAGLAVFALLSPSILISVGALTSAERSVLFFLALLLLSVKRFEYTRSPTWAVAAVIFGQMMIYYKEPAFLLLLGFASGRLFLRCLPNRFAGENHGRLRDIESRLDWCLLSLCVLYLIVYWYAVLRKSTDLDYAIARQLSFAEVVLGSIQHDFIAWIFLIFFLSRVYLIMRGDKSPVPFWDGLALGGVAYLLFYQFFRMYDQYLLAPVDLIAIMYVGRFTILSWKYLATWSRVVAFLVALIVVVQGVVLSCLATLERKNIIQGKSAIAGAVEAQFRSGKQIRLFFPFANPHVISEFGAYLSYRGLPIEGVGTQTGRQDNVVLAAKVFSNDGPCEQRYNPMICHAVKEPISGDLIVILPEDGASGAEAFRYCENGEQLVSRKPRPYVPPRLYSLLGNRWSIGGVDPGRFLLRKPLPDRWLQGCVTVWK
jgi:hypothetical protein